MVLCEYEKFLSKYYKEEIVNLLNNRSDCNHASILIDLVALKTQNNKFYCEIINNIQKILLQWDDALLNVQKDIANNDDFLDPDYSIKQNCHIRFCNLPRSEDILCGTFPDNECIGVFVQVKGNVVQMSHERLLEIKREMICSKCNSTFTFEAQYGKMYSFDLPMYCLNKESCRGLLRAKYNLPKPEFCMDFQQIRIQELAAAENETYPSSLTICLENDLVNTCKPGECITICGTVEVRWCNLITGSRGLHILSLRANSITKDNIRPSINKDYNERMICARTNWQETVDNFGFLNTRNLIVNSLCPEITGMSFIKFGLILALCSGFDIKKQKSAVRRGHSHVLLIGDPGTGKSKLLKSICDISPGAINTNGLGCSAAGLTAAAFKDGSEWNLQAGALVLADGGICCIDQFNLMHEHDKAAVHETMEQQTISIAKAGLVCKLQTQCAIFATANLKNFFKSASVEKFDPVNFKIGTPLLSRFDLIFAISDEREINVDFRITNHLLKLTNIKAETTCSAYWNQDKLQSHFIAVKNINPKFHDLAGIILGSYYKYYRSGFERDLARTTVRMLDSLYRLAQSHARLMFREEVLAFDAIVVIQLVEKTWGFGKIIKKTNNEDILSGINDETLKKILSALNLTNLEGNIMEEINVFTNNQGCFKSQNVNNLDTEQHLMRITECIKNNNETTSAFNNMHNKSKGLLLNNDIELSHDSPVKINKFNTKLIKHSELSLGSCITTKKSDLISKCGSEQLDKPILSRNIQLNSQVKNCNLIPTNNTNVHISSQYSNAVMQLSSKAQNDRNLSINKKSIEKSKVGNQFHDDSDLWNFNPELDFSLNIAHNKIDVLQPNIDTYCDAKINDTNNIALNLDSHFDKPNKIAHFNETNTISQSDLINCTIFTDSNFYNKYKKKHDFKNNLFDKNKTENRLISTVPHKINVNDSDVNFDKPHGNNINIDTEEISATDKKRNKNSIERYESLSTSNMHNNEVIDKYWDVVLNQSNVKNKKVIQNELKKTSFFESQICDENFQKENISIHLGNSLKSQSNLNISPTTSEKSVSFKRKDDIFTKNKQSEESTLNKKAKYSESYHHISLSHVCQTLSETEDLSFLEFNF